MAYEYEGNLGDFEKSFAPKTGGGNFDLLGVAGGVGLGAGIVNDVVGIAGTIDNIVSGHRREKEQKRQYDQTFNENVRQFGLQYALQDFATRKGISMQEAASMLNAEKFGLEKQAASENLKTSALGRNITATQFGWQKEDRAKKQAYAKALQKGLIMGMVGGGK